MRRHVTPGRAVPLQPEAVAFAGHYGFDIDVLAAYRPTGKGRVERYVEITRDHVLAGQSFRSLAQADAAFMTWVPIRRAQVHRTHGEVIAERARIDHAALRPLPAVHYVVTEIHTRRVGKDCLISLNGSHYSVPARAVRAGQRGEVRPTASEVTIRALPADGGDLLATHPRATRPKSWIVDQAHWDGLPDGHIRATTTVIADLQTAPTRTRRRGTDHHRGGTAVDRVRGRRRAGRLAMSELTSTRIQQAAERLDLTHLPDHVMALVTRTQTEQLGYFDFLDLVLGEEVELREQRRFRNALKLSGLPHHKTLAEFDHTFQPSLEPRRIRDLASLGFVETRWPAPCFLVQVI